VASMANPDHVAKLKEGVETWNQWRAKNLSVVPDLSGVKLGGKNLSGINLSNAFLHASELALAELGKVDLHKANLRGANLREAKLHQARRSPPFLWWWSPG
jgi:uncharacterized protein YjbI with pentapeptide repeats